MSIQRQETYLVKEPQPATTEAALAEAAKLALAGKIDHVARRTEGTLILLNVERELITIGFDPHQELLKGLIVDREGKIVAPCFPKFYNLGEREETDALFLRLLGDEEVKVYLPRKVDGTNIRLFINPDTQEVAAATRNMITGGNFGEEALRIAEEKYPQILDPDLLSRYTPIFELITPELHEGSKEEELYLLGVYDKSNGCREFSRAEIEEFAGRYGLTVVPLLPVSVDRTNWEKTAAQLEAFWQSKREQMLEEGTVVTFERGGEVACRMKVKFSEYLRTLYEKSGCGLNALVKIVNSADISSFEGLMDKVEEQRAAAAQKRGREYAPLSEEVIMGWEELWKRYEAWLKETEEAAQEGVERFKAFMQEHPELRKKEDANEEEQHARQKEFAAAVQPLPNGSDFLALRNLRPERGRERVLARIRRERPPR